MSGYLTTHEPFACEADVRIVKPGHAGHGTPDFAIVDAGGDIKGYAYQEGTAHAYAAADLALAACRKLMDADNAGDADVRSFELDDATLLAQAALLVAKTPEMHEGGQP